jgi:exo-1,4-beta-D-glucosaminidase
MRARLPFRLLAVAGIACLGLGAQQIELHSGWAIQSSAQVAAAPAALATPGFAQQGWMPAAVPTTVFAARVANHLELDPDYGMNLRQAAGVSYKIGANFSHDEIPADSAYAVPWWYRTEFTLPAAFTGKTLWLDFRGINYRANIWLNGKQIAGEDQVRGTFRQFEFDVTGIAHSGRNALAVEVYAPRVQDLAITFVDWNPMPPDKDMGIWGKVFLRASGPVTVRDTWVKTQLDLPSLAKAHLAISTTLTNATGQPQRGRLVGYMDARRFTRTITLPPHARQVVTVPMEVTHPRLWWPQGMGTAALHHLSLAFQIGGRVSDQSRQDFGMDQITAEKNDQGSEQFYVNGKKVFVRGGGWTPDMMLRDGPAKWATDFLYARTLGLNTIRLEGKLMDDAFFDLADRNGILVMAGWCCCDHWEEWSKWKDDEGQVATASLRDQALRLRGHASVLVWLNGSDNPPPAQVETAYLDVLHQAQWPKPILSSASAKPTKVTGASGVKMTGPYDYVPPVYWLAEPEHGGARGFNTETSPGAAIPPLESLEKFIPADHLWTGTGPGQGPDDPYWNFHAGSGNFLNLHRYEAALTARYGAPATLRDFVWESQASSYEGERAMFEAFGRRQGEATGVIQWMLNNGWPSLIWHLYDYYLRPGAGFYGVERANEPLHVQYSDFDRAISVVNHGLTPAGNLVAHALVADLSGKPLYRQSHIVRVGPQSSADAWSLPQFPGTTFLELTLTQGNRAVSRNFYWLSARPDVLNDKAGNWFYTPESSAADFSALDHLPPAQVRAQASFTHRGAQGAATVRITNQGSGVALLVRLRILRGPGGAEVLPVEWQDNYISLMPGESRVVRVQYRLQDVKPAVPTLAVDGWNVAWVH